MPRSVSENIRTGHAHVRMDGYKKRVVVEAVHREAKVQNKCLMNSGKISYHLLEEVYRTHVT